MAFGQTFSGCFNSWGVAPGYGDKRPSAKRRPCRFNDNTCVGQQGRCPGYGENWPSARRRVHSSSILSPNISGLTVLSGKAWSGSCGAGSVGPSSSWREDCSCNAQRLCHGDVSASAGVFPRRMVCLERGIARQPACTGIRRVSRDLVRQRQRRSRARPPPKCSSATGCFRPWASRCWPEPPWNSTGPDKWPRG